MNKNSSPIQPAQSHEMLAKQEMNTYRISLVTGILMVAISIISTISTIQTGLYSFSGIVVTSIIAIVAFISSILLLSLTLPLSAKGQGLALAAMTVILVSGIASTTLSPRLAGRIVITSIASGIVLIFLDLFLPYQGLPTDSRVTNVIAIVMTVVYGIVIIRQFSNYSLRTKLILGLVAVATLSTVMVSLVVNRTIQSY
jgi:hypothetical protein